MSIEINNILPAYCSFCQHGQVYGPYWNPGFEEDDYAVYCTKLNKYVHEDLHWTECARTTSKHTGIDVPGDFCPLKKHNETLQENTL